MTLPPILTPDEVAQLMGCEPAQVRLRAEDLGGVKLGRDWRFVTSVLLERLAAMAAQPRKAEKPLAVAHPPAAAPTRARARRQAPHLPSLTP